MSVADTNSHLPIILHNLFLSEVAVMEPGQPIRQGGLVPLILCGRCLRPRETGSGLTLRVVSRQIFMKPKHHEDRIEFIITLTGF